MSVPYGTYIPDEDAGLFSFHRNECRRNVEIRVHVPVLPAWVMRPGWLPQERPDEC